MNYEFQKKKKKISIHPGANIKQKTHYHIRQKNVGKHFCVYQKSSAHTGTSYADGRDTSVDSHPNPVVVETQKGFSHTHTHTQ